MRALALPVPFDTEYFDCARANPQVGALTPVRQAGVEAGAAAGAEPR